MRPQIVGRKIGIALRVLIVEDEPRIAAFVRQGLVEAGYAVDAAGDGEEGLAFATSGEHDILVVDILLPKSSGLQLLREFRGRGFSAPVLLLTARDTIEDRVAGLDAGADDYLVKPFAFAELLARIRALLRRPPLQSDPILCVGALEVDTARRTACLGERPIDLSPREFAVLEYLVRHPGQVLTRAQIAEHVWSFEFAAGSNVLDVYIGYLRRKLDQDVTQSLIETVRGVGYRLRDEEHCA